MGCVNQPQKRKTLTIDYPLYQQTTRHFSGLAPRSPRSRRKSVAAEIHLKMMPKSEGSCWTISYIINYNKKNWYRYYLFVIHSYYSYTILIIIYYFIP